MTTTPGRAIRQTCIDCVGLASDVKGCMGDKLKDCFGNTYQCLLYPYRMGRGRPKLRTIRAFCLWCMGESQKLVRECHTKGCPLYPYHMGKNPKLEGRGGRKWNFRASKAEKHSTQRAIQI